MKFIAFLFKAVDYLVVIGKMWSFTKCAM